MWVIESRSVVIASGARYRQLAVDGLESFEAASVHYWASPLEAKLCAGQEVASLRCSNSGAIDRRLLATSPMRALRRSKRDHLVRREAACNVRTPCPYMTRSATAVRISDRQCATAP